MTPERLANLREHLESRAKAGDFYITHNEAVLEFLDEIERLGRRRGGECRKCGRWVCPPLTCMSCLADAPEELRKINADLTAEVERLTRERDALIDLHVQRSAVVNHELWDVLLPDGFSPLGFAWTQDIDTRAEAVAMLLKAAGVDPEEPS